MLSKKYFEMRLIHTFIVSHGNIFTLLLKHYQRDEDFQFWKNLSNPNVYQLTMKENAVTLERIWKREEKHG